MDEVERWDEKITSFNLLLAEAAFGPVSTWLCGRIGLRLLLSSLFSFINFASCLKWCRCPGNSLVSDSGGSSSIPESPGYYIWQMLTITSNFNMDWNHLEGLLNHRLLVPPPQRFWSGIGGPWEFVLIRSSKVIPMFVVLRPGFENNWGRRFLGVRGACKKRRFIEVVPLNGRENSQD